MAKLTVLMPPGVKAHVTVECAREGLMLDEVVQALLEARFPRKAAAA